MTARQPVNWNRVKLGKKETAKMVAVQEAIAAQRRARAVALQELLSHRWPDRAQRASQAARLHRAFGQGL
jgi:hypothetical protein